MGGGGRGRHQFHVKYQPRDTVSDKFLHTCCYLGWLQNLILSSSSEIDDDQEESNPETSEKNIDVS